MFSKVHLAPITFLSMFFVLFATHLCTDDVVELLEIHTSMARMDFVCVSNQLEHELNFVVATKVILKIKSLAPK